MRPHRLRVQAFGAFAGTEQVSFDDLEGLFLLHGETGAGKTTLLDAIAFALYGRVPGERGTVKRLRSDHAAPGLATEVELEATIGGRRLRITRKPEQDRPKKSGVGFTKEQAAVRLDEQSAVGGWENKSTRVVEADQEIRDLMGMSAEQFFQVVLLPQGQFAQFLHAKAQEKEELLRKLFSTDRFRKVEDWLAELRRATEKESAAAAESVSLLVARIAQAAEVPVPDSAPAVPAAPAVSATAAATDGPELASDPAPWQSAWATWLVGKAAVARDEAAGLMAERKRDLGEKRAAQLAAGQLADRQRRRRDALRKHEELKTEAPGIERLRAEANEADRAAVVAPVLDVADRAASAAQQAQRAEIAARARIPRQPAHPADATAAALRAAAEEQRVNLGRLDQLGKVAQDAADEDKGAAVARVRAAQFEAELAAIESAAAHRKQNRQQAAQARDGASQAAAALPEAQAAADSARRTADDWTALVTDRARWERLYKSHLTAQEKANESRATALDVREARIDGMRAELAATMIDGTPCPVCGSLEHPDPVEPTFEPVSRDQEEAANALADHAAAQADKAARDLTAIEARISELAHRLAGSAEANSTPADALPAALQADSATLAAAARQANAEAERLETEATRLKTRAAGLPARQRDLEALDDAIAGDKIRLTELTDQRAAELDKAEAAAKRADDRRAKLSAQLGDALDLDTAVSAARSLADALTRAADAADETARAQAALLDARRRAAAAAIDGGFGPQLAAAADQALPTSDEAPAAIAAARAAFRDARWRQDKRGRIERHKTDAEAVAKLLADPELDVALDPPAPVAETTEAAEAAERAHSAAAGAHVTADNTASALAKLRPLLANKLATLAPLVQRADQIRQLADLANGQGANQYKMTLSSFVLAARLEEVAAAASQRLRTMTGGRYSLAHSDARRGNSRAGLSLLACDSWTGVDRDTATLSGGETFLASLSLALGLADVVTAEAAGTPMEALFVDEGFGTLDEETLDEVMNVLDGLRAGGRIVGIVSHVTELRQRIPAQVHVAKGRHGSHVTVSAG
jgi:exonuclease SbcC